MNDHKPFARSAQITKAEEEEGRREVSRRLLIRRNLGELVMEEAAGTDPDDFRSEWSEDEVRDVLRSGQYHLLPQRVQDGFKPACQTVTCTAGSMQPANRQTDRTIRCRTDCNAPAPLMKIIERKP